MSRTHRTLAALFVLAALATGGAARADSAPATTSATAPASAGQGVAVVAVGSAREEAATLARAVYASSLRPRRLDELRARILVGDPAPPGASRPLKELAELRASIHGEDAASRRLLASVARELGVQGLLVLSVEPAEAAAPSADASAEPQARVTESDAGADGASAPRGPAVARLFLAETGDFDAARYVPEPGGGPGAWSATVRSIERRLPAPPWLAAPAVTARPAGPAPTVKPSDTQEKKPFYASPWLWGAIGAAVLVGGFVYFASRDTSDDPIHLQMRVPR